MDLEAVEMGFRAALHQAGAALSLSCCSSPSLPPTAQHPVPVRPPGHLPRTALATASHCLGEVELSRPWYLCPHCHNGQFPVDRQLDVEDRDLSPGVRRMQALVGQQAPFDRRSRADEGPGRSGGDHQIGGAHGGSHWRRYRRREQREIRKAVQLDLPVVVGEPIPILYVQMDGTGVPVVKKETEGRKGKADGQPAHTREAKLGCVFTQTTLGQRRLCDSRSGFDHLYRSHRNRRRVRQTHLSGSLEPWLEPRAKKVVIGDGAEWIWNLADHHFPGAIQIVDLYHARQHLWEVARKLHPNDPNQKAWMKVHQKRLLDKGKIEKLVLSLRSVDSTTLKRREDSHRGGLLRANTERMRYPKFRRSTCSSVPASSKPAAKP
jgi:hypothetical protein